MVLEVAATEDRNVSETCNGRKSVNAITCCNVDNRKFAQLVALKVFLGICWRKSYLASK